MLSSVALINRALESGDMNTVWKQLSSSVTGLTNIEEENCQRWVPLTLTSLFSEPTSYFLCRNPDFLVIIFWFPRPTPAPRISIHFIMLKDL